tara:strand:- start:21081 stop:22025 length:945 start_codon:yes stop_codon:yes gene_type:complete
MKVSLIVSIYNGADILHVTLPPLFNQTYSSDKYEVILVNDASTDDSKRLIEEYRNRPQCRIIHHNKNKGRCITRNSGIISATGDILIFLDCDIEVNENFIEHHLKFHEKSSVMGVVSNLQPGTQKIKNKYHKYLFYSKRGAKTTDQNKAIPFKYFVLTCTSVKSEAVKKTGLFPTDLPGYGIDLEYAYRLSLNFKSGFYFAPDIRVAIHKLKTLEEAISNFREYGENNLPIILDRYSELAPYCGADYVTSQGAPTLKTIAGSLLANKFTLWKAKWLLPLIPFPLSNKVIRFILAASTITGYRNTIKRRGGISEV